MASRLGGHVVLRGVPRRRRLRRGVPPAPGRRGRGRQAPRSAVPVRAGWPPSGSSRTAPTGSSWCPAPTPRSRRRTPRRRRGARRGAGRGGPAGGPAGRHGGRTGRRQAPRCGHACSTRRPTRRSGPTCWPRPTGWCPTRSSSPTLAVEHRVCPPGEADARDDDQVLALGRAWVQRWWSPSARTVRASGRGQRPQGADPAHGPGRRHHRCR